VISSENSDPFASAPDASVFSALFLEEAHYDFGHRPLHFLFADRLLKPPVLQLAFDKHLSALRNGDDVLRLCRLAEEHALMPLRDGLPFVILLTRFEVATDTRATAVPPGCTSVRQLFRYIR